jgi:hypothetical protein
VGLFRSSGRKGIALPAGRLFFPLDQQLKLGVEGYSPALVRKIVSQGGRYAFTEAAHNLKELAELEISAQHVLRLTERIGTEWAARRDQEIEQHKQDQLPRAYTQPPRAATAMLDGGRIQTREAPSGPGVVKPEWHEPKYACFQTLNTHTSSCDPQPTPPTKFLDKKRVPKLVRQIQSVRGATTVRETEKEKTAKRPPRKKARKRLTRRTLRTVIATTLGVTEFGFQVAAEVHRRGLDRAQVKGCVCDGQNSNWSVFDDHLKPLGFIPILDFLHLLSYLYAAAQAAGGTEDECWDRYVQWLTWAWKGQRDKLLLGINGAAARIGTPPENASETDSRCVVAKTQTYVTNNIDKMDYARYRKLGLPISSAPIESTIKQFNKRVKGTEKFWRPNAAEAVLQVRAAQLSDDGREERHWSMPRPIQHAAHHHALAAA